ncbi:hypothetical protein IAT38_005551 [Cryptococcus sp. DSM 104549]
MTHLNAELPWKRLIRFIAKEDGQEYLGEPVDPVMDVGLAQSTSTPILAHVFDGLTPWDPRLRRTGHILRVHRLLSPITPSQAGTVRATGLSYKDHAIEMGMPFPAVPAVFFKPATSITDPGADVPVPRCCQREEMDYEVELAVVLGRDCKDVDERRAGEYVLGWTGANDLTARKHQGDSSQWGFSKGFDKFLPLGPCLVSARDVPDPHVVALKTTLNGRVMQNGNAATMIFPINRIIAYLSQGTTLPAGTVIITGTPPGIGDGRTPKVWLKDGDEVKCWLSHGVGTLVNRIKYE